MYIACFPPHFLYSVSESGVSRFDTPETSPYGRLDDKTEQPLSEGIRLSGYSASGSGQL